MAFARPFVPWVEYIDESRISATHGQNIETWNVVLWTDLGMAWARPGLRSGAWTCLLGR